MKIYIAGKPEGKQRPRATLRGGFAKLYTPKETVSYENLVKIEYRVQDNTFYSRETPLKIDILCVYSLPDSFSKIKRQKALNGEIKPLVKPDLDNVAKIILDALNGVAFADDKQIVAINIQKTYGEKSYVEFELGEVK